MTPEEREALRRAAEEATEGEWWVNPDGYAAEVVMRSQPSSCIADCGGYEMDPDEFIAASADAAFIAATDPPTVLSLLDQVARLEREVTVERTANKVAENHNHFDCAVAMAKKDLEVARLSAALDVARERAEVSDAALAYLASGRAIDPAEYAADARDALARIDKEAHDA